MPRVNKTRKYKPSSLAALEDLEKGVNVSKSRVDTYVREGRITRRQVEKARAAGILEKLRHGQVIPVEVMVSAMSSGHVNWSDIMDAEEEGKRAREKKQATHKAVMEEMKRNVTMRRFKNLQPALRAELSAAVSKKNYKSKLMTNILSLPSEQYSKFQTLRTNFTKKAGRTGKTAQQVMENAYKMATRTEKEAVSQKRLTKREREALASKKNETKNKK